MRYIYWIPRGRSKVKTVIYKCGVCRKYDDRPYKMPKLADWPKEKISKAAPFIHHICKRKQSEEGLDLYLHICMLFVHCIWKLSTI